LCQTVAGGAHSVKGTEVTIKRVPELVPEEVARRAGAKLDREAPIASVEELPDYDAIIFGAPTRFRQHVRTDAQLSRSDRRAVVYGKLVGKVASVFTSTATQHGGQETTITSFHTTLLHHGMIIVGLPYSSQEPMNVGEITGGSPYGACSLAGTDGCRRPSENELAIARFQGPSVAGIAMKL